MEQNGIFISYQMAEAIELIEGFNLNVPEEKAKAEESLLELKKRWLNDTLPGTNIKIGDKFTGMQDITIDDIVQISALAKQADTYTLENAGAFQHLLVTNENGQFAFDFEKLDKIASLARKNNKKIIIDSTIVFGDHFPFKIANLDKETISKLIGEYTKQLTGKYGNVIDRMDVLNSIFQRAHVSPENNAEEFWIKTFGENYGQEVINIVRNNMDSRYPNIKLGWNEFYLTNSNFEQRKIDFLNRVKSTNGLDVIGVQDRFMSGESIDYIISSLDEIATVSKEANKEVCITEFGCSASGIDLRNGNTEIINSKIQNIMNAVKNYSSKSDNIKRIEGRICDKFDFNYGELKNMGFDISTTGRKGVAIERTHIDKKDTPFDKRSQGEVQVYQQIKEKNQIIKQQKAQQKQIEKPKTKILTKPSSNGSGQNGNKGFANAIMLSLIVSFVCGALFMVVYMIIGRYS